MVKTRNLKMHNKLLLDVIKRQAGSLNKAILEGVMNAIEANAPRVDITFNADDIGQGQPGAVLTIEDEGEGIQSEEDIQHFFETFGTPHEENERKIWAQFRMGRGQLFSFGRNIWETSTFLMDVDIDKRGLSYELHHDRPFVEGCKIKVELYKNPIGEWSTRTVESLKDDVKKQVEFMDTPIYFNGEQLNTPPADLKWTFEDENAYYMFGAGNDLRIYNLGAYTMSMAANRAGVTGVVVSKKQLKVNFARNDVQSDCPVYIGIQEVVKVNRIKKTRAAYRRLTSNERTATLIDIRDGIQDIDDVKTLGLFETSSGKVLNINTLLSGTSPWSFAKQFDRTADQLMQAGVAVCVDQGVMSDLNYTGEPKSFFTWLIGRCVKVSKGYIPGKTKKRLTNMENRYHDFSTLSSGLSRTSTIASHSSLTKLETRILRVLSDIDQWEGRTLMIGVSDIADGWTDGNTFIAISRRFLKKLSLSYPEDAGRLIFLLVHELAHDDDSLETNIHGEEFYRRYHELTQLPWVGGAIGRLPNQLRNALQKERTQTIIDKQNKAEAKVKEKLGMT